MSEIIDLVDETGFVRKSEVPRHEVSQYEDLYMQIVIVVVFDSLGRVLVHRRAMTKEVNPGDIDHICGAVISGETPEAAAIREAREETGVTLNSLKLVNRGVNQYGRYCYLMVGAADDDPKITNPNEVMWVGYLSLEELRQGQISRSLTFVDGFFEDVELATAIVEELSS